MVKEIIRWLLLYPDKRKGYKEDKTIGHTLMDSLLYYLQGG